MSGDFSETLGVATTMGPAITGSDDRPESAVPGAVINYPFWPREFAGGPKVLTHTISLNGRSFPNMGVTPAAFFRRRGGATIRRRGAAVRGLSFAIIPSVPKRSRSDTFVAVV